MLPEIFNVFKDGVAIFITGLVIKITDDCLDQSIDQGKETLSKKLKEAALPYSLLIYSIAVILNLQISIGLFLGAYIVGMFGDLTRPQSFKLKGYQECLLVFFLSIMFLGVKISIFAILSMLIIQIIDDLIDLNEDQKRGSSNLIAKFGKLEMLFLLLISFLITGYISMYYLTISMLVYPFIGWVLSFLGEGN